MWRWNRSGPLKINVNILAAYHTPFELFSYYFRALIEFKFTYVVVQGVSVAEQ